MIRRALRNIVYAMPGTQALWLGINRALGRGQRPIQFSGWGMKTETTPPWCDGGGDRLTKDFMRVNSELAERVGGGEFRLSQFDAVTDKAGLLGELRWRHYVVFWSARYASQTTRSSVKNLVECGVCDGLTAYYAMSAVKGSWQFNTFLYDAWEAMKSEYLLESERTEAGQYSYLSLDNTKRNLQPFDGNAFFVKGFIPDSFKNATIPSEIAWLHIDLNSALPTAAALNALFDRMPSGAVILFDDYGWVGWHDTKLAIDRFFEGKPGVLLPMPTGQAMFFKHEP